MTLADLGWNDAFEEQFKPYYKNGWKPARLIRDNKITYGALLIDKDGEIDEREVILSGKVYHDAETDADLPAVGDGRRGHAAQHVSGRAARRGRAHRSRRAMGAVVVACVVSASSAATPRAVAQGQSEPTASERAVASNLLSA